MRWLLNHFQDEDDVLHACIRDGNLRKLQQSLAASPAPDINYNHHGFGPPIHFASWCGDMEAVELLLAVGADPLLVSRGEENLTAIGFAAQRGHREIVKRLWTFCPPEAHLSTGRRHLSCFLVAALHGHAAIVQDLLDWWDGWPHDLRCRALLGAARRWHFAVATLLLNRTTFESSILQEALQMATTLRLLMSDGDDGKCDGIDYLNQQLVVELLIDAGADPNACPNDTPLIYTAAYDANLTGVLKTLLEKGADPNKANGSGRPEPTMMNETTIRLLLQHGASVAQPDNADQGQDALLRLTNNHGETLLHFAAAGCRVETMDFLISQGLDVNARSSNGWTPLMCALVPIESRFGRVTSMGEAIRAARILLSHGADTGIVTDEGWTPLHALSLHRDGDVRETMAGFARDLLLRGVNPESCARMLSPDKRTVVPSLGLPWGGHHLRDAMANPSAQRLELLPAMTPLYWAAIRGAVGVVRALVAHGVDVSSMDEDGISPTRMAAESKFLERQSELVEAIIELLLAAGAGF
ncbi:hypothetical protein A9Z42_0092800 [Trichoderma parareesei]|uniref:Uncharacterized protein n=1 Tax=Trichoderma parareesei TaxID=858221 RepID=A0A2H2ZNH4_TRIPA|nr:hypothetical protein A9Z42_0092800 [Trichoderma parareesei]